MDVTNIKLFKNIFTELDKICDEIKFKIYEDKLYCAFMNRGHTVFCRANIKCIITKPSEVSEEFILDLHQFSKILKNIGSTGELTLTLSESYLDIKYVDKSKKKYRMGLVEYSNVDNRELPKMDYQLFTVPLEFIKESLKDIKLVSTKSCRFTTHDEYFLISLKEPTVMLTEYENSIYVGEYESQQSSYALALLDLFLNFKEVSKTIDIGFKEKNPLKLVINNDEATIEGVVAPFLDTEECY